MGIVGDFVDDGKHVLVAGVGEDDDGEAGEGFDGSGPGEVAHRAGLVEGVACDEVGEDNYDEIGD